MVNRIKEKKVALDARRPLAPGTIAQLDAWYDVELTYTSNAIEGNTLTRSETAVVLEKGITVRGKPLKDHFEATDHKDALDYARRLASRNEALREGDVRELHRLVLGRSNPEQAGRYSTVQRFLKGSQVTFPPPIEIAPRMAEFGRWLMHTSEEPEDAFEAHARLVGIHPFTDGNGRTARLLMNLMLIKNGYPPLVIAPEHRPDYIDALEARHLDDENAPFVTFMTARLEESLDRYLEAIEKELEARRGGPIPPSR